jgi:hypothetical protein
LFSNYERFIPLDDLWCSRHELIFREEVHSGCVYAISFEAMAQDDPPVTLYGGMPTGHAVSETILLDLVTTTITNGPTYVLHDALNDDWIPTARFKPTAIWGWWEAIDTMVGMSGIAKCRTAEAYQHLVEDFGDRVERLN